MSKVYGAQHIELGACCSSMCGCLDQRLKNNMVMYKEQICTMGMQWNNETMPCRMSSIAKRGRASYKEDTMRSETGEQCKKLWIGMMRDTIAKKVQKMTRIALVLPCHSRLDDDCFFWEIINTCLVLIANNWNTWKLEYSNWKFVAHIWIHICTCCRMCICMLCSVFAFILW